MKLSITNEKELKAALNHLMYAKSEIINVACIIDKRGEYSSKLKDLYKYTFRVHEELENIIKDAEVTAGGK